MVVELLAILVAGFGLLVVALFLKIRSLRARLETMVFDKKSQSVRYGKMSEQFLPFMRDYPYDPERFRFLGTPIDGVQFERDQIVFMEFKTGRSTLSARQKEIKALIEKKKVAFEEVRIDEDAHHHS